MKTFTFALVLSGLMASSASAAVMSLHRDGMSAGDDSRKVTITTVPISPDSDTSAVIPGTIRAGGFSMSDTGGIVGNFVAWCLDLEHWLHTMAEYQTTDTPFTNSYLDSAGQVRVQAMFDANFDQVDPFDGISSASFQLALWEAVYDDEFDLTNGAFTAMGAEESADDVTELAASYLDNARSYAGGQQYELSFLQSLASSSGPYTYSQNLVTTTVAAVPVPAAALGLLTGIAGLGMVARRRRRAA